MLNLFIFALFIFLLVFLFFFFFFFRSFLCYHIYLIKQGQTTNESFKWALINKTHKKLIKAHQNYLELSRPENIEKIEIVDGKNNFITDFKLSQNQNSTKNVKFQSSGMGVGGGVIGGVGGGGMGMGTGKNSCTSTIGLNNQIQIIRKDTNSGTTTATTATSTTTTSSVVVETVLTPLS